MSKQSASKYNMDIESKRQQYCAVFHFEEQMCSLQYPNDIITVASLRLLVIFEVVGDSCWGDELCCLLLRKFS